MPNNSDPETISQVRRLRFKPTRPPSIINDILQIRQSRLLSNMLLALVSLGSISAILQLLFVPGFLPTFQALAASIVFLLSAFLINRSGGYRIAARITCITLSLGSFIIALSINTTDVTSFVFMLVSVLFSAILLDRWFTLAIAALNLLAILLLPSLQPAWSAVSLAGPISYNIIFSLLIVIFMWHRDLVEHDQEKELRESELKFRAIFDSSVDAIGVSKAGIHVMLNPAYLKMFRYESADQLVGSSILDLIAPSHRPLVLEYVRRRAAGEEVPVFYETRGLRSDGSEFDMEVYISTYELSGERYTVPTLRDITVRKQTEAALEQRTYELGERVKELHCLFEIAELIEQPDISLEEILQGALELLPPAWQQPSHTCARLTLQGQTYQTSNFQQTDWRLGSEITINGAPAGMLEIFLLREPAGYAQVFLPEEGRLLKAVAERLGHIVERHRVKEALQETEIIFSAFLEYSPVYVFFKDKNIRTLRLSRNYEQMLGVPIDEATGKTMDELFPSELARSMVADDLRILREGERVQVIEEFNGRIYETTKFPIFLDNEPALLAGFTLDITDRKRMEDALRRSMLTQAAILDNIPDLAWLKDEESRFIAANGPFGQACGVAPAELVGKTDLDIWSQELAQVYRKDDFEVMRTRKRKHFEERMVDSAGQVRWIETIKTPFFDKNDKVIGTVGIARDITDRKAFSEALARSGERFAQVTDCAGVWVWEVDSKGVYTYASPTVEKILGYKPEELVGKKHFYDLFAPEGGSPLIESIFGIFSQKEVFRNLENVNLRKDGQIVFLETSGMPVLDEHRNLIGYRGADRDVSERKAAELALRVSQERYRTLAQNLPDSALLLFDRDLRFIIADGPELGAIGFSSAALEGKTLQEALPAEFRRVVEPDLLRTLDGHSFSAELPFEGRIYQYSYVPLRDSSGEVVMGMILATNITRRKQIEDALKNSERRLRTALQATKVGIWEWDMRTNQAYWSEENYQVLGLTPGETDPRYENWAKCVHPDDLPIAEARVAEAANQRSELNIEFRVIWPDGSIHWINDIGDMLIDETSGEPLGMYGIQMDVTERKRMEEMLFAEKERAEVTLYSIGDAVITTDVHSSVEYLNPVAENLTGWKLEEAIGQPLDQVFRIIDESSRQPASNPAERCMREGKVVGLANHSVLIRRDGREFAIADSAAPIRDRRGEVIGVVLVFHDVTEERRLTQQVAYDAMHDNLTGLVNRREFENRLGRALINTKEHHTSHILCYLDLDQFKIVNDTAGHAAGDELLKQVAGLLKGLFRQRDTFARLGGDEFGLLLENCQLDQAVVICSEIKARIRNFPFIWAGHGFQVGVSIGVVPITPDKESINQLLSQADIACYSAKDLGRDRIYVYHTEDSETAQRHGEILQAARMRDAIFNDQFRLFCQPIVQVAEEQEKTPQFEVLLRLVDSGDSLVLPSAFIPSAERYGLMPAIDRWVIRETCKHMAKHDLSGVLININLSAKSLDDDALLEFVLEQLDEFSIQPSQICFEITETAAIHLLSKAQRFIKSFRELGGKIALDDFGSGFSSFQYLKTLPVDYIKIDGSFVSDMLSNPGDLLMVEAITQIAHTLGIKVIAEHATGFETIDRLRKMGVDRAQGFDIGLPAPVETTWGSH